MTVSTTISQVTLIGNGSTTLFAFSFVYVSASRIRVIYTNASGVETLLSPSVYTLTLTPPATGQIWGVGGTVLYPLSGSPIASGTSITIQRVLPFTQTTSLSNQGNFYPQVVETALDTLCMELQQATDNPSTIPNNLSLNTSFAGSGTAARTLQSHFGDILNVDDFGAVGDGVTDDSATIQAALNATTAGGVLRMSAKTYKIATGLTRTSPITLIGAGLYGAGGTRLKYTGAGGTAFTFNTTGAGLILENFTVDGASSSGAANGILMDNIANGIRLTSVYVESFASGTAFTVDDGWDISAYSCIFRYSLVGVRLKKGGTYSVVNNVRFYGCGMPNNSTGAIIEAGANNIFDGVDFTACTTLCVSIAPSLATSIAKGNVIRNCYIEPSAGGKGVEIGVGATTGASNVAGNIIAGNYMDSTVTYVKTDYAQDTIISDNIFGAVTGGFYTIDITANSLRTMIKTTPRNNIHDLGTSTLFYTNDVQSLVEASGNYTSPQRGAVEFYLSADINNVTGNGTEYKVAWNTQVINRQSEQNASNGTFTAQKSGMYTFSTCVTVNAITGATQATMRLVTTANNFTLADFRTVAGATIALNGTCTAYLAAGDTADIRVMVNGVGGDTSDILAGTTTKNSWFTVSFQG